MGGDFFENAKHVTLPVKNTVLPLLLKRNKKHSGSSYNMRGRNTIHITTRWAMNAKKRLWKPFDR